MRLLLFVFEDVLFVVCAVLLQTVTKSTLLHVNHGDVSFSQIKALHVDPVLCVLGSTASSGLCEGTRRDGLGVHGPVSGRIPLQLLRPPISIATAGDTWDAVSRGTR